MNEQVKNNKGDKAKNILIVILFIVIIGLVGYICLNKFVFMENKTEATSSTKKENTTTSEVKEESVTFSDSDLEKYVGYIQPVFYTSKLLYDIDKVDAKNLSISKKIEYIGSLVASKETSSSDYAYNIISEDNVKSALETVYGPNTYEKTTFNLGCGDFTLNESDHNYYSQSGCGGTSAFFVSNQIIGYTATKSKLEITTAYVFYAADKNTIYKDYNETIALGSYNGGDTISYNDYLKDYVKTNKDKLNTLVYTFESTDGVNYYFTKLVNNK